MFALGRGTSPSSYPKALHGRVGREKRENLSTVKDGKAWLGLKAEKGCSSFPKDKHYLRKDDLVTEIFTDLLLTTAQP